MKRAVIAGAAAAAAITASLVSAPASADPHDDDPPTDRITIHVATVNGTGCKQGTAAVAVAPDNTAFTVTYSDYLAQAGGDSNPIDFRKNCQLNLEVHVPQGFTYAIARADYRGFAHLEAGAGGMQQAGYYFQGQSGTTFVEHTLESPHSDNWQFTDEVDVADLVFKPCGVTRNFNVNTELRVSRGDDSAKTSFITMDSTDGSIDTKYHFSWKRCPRV